MRTEQRRRRGASPLTTRPGLLDDPGEHGPRPRACLDRVLASTIELVLVLGVDERSKPAGSLAPVSSAPALEAPAARATERLSRHEPVAAADAPGSGPPKRRRLPRPAEQERRAEERDLVDQAGRQERAEHLRRRPRPSRSSGPARQSASSAQAGRRGRPPRRPDDPSRRTPRAAARQRRRGPSAAQHEHGPRARRSATQAARRAGRRRRESSTTRVNGRRSRGCGQQQRVVGQHGADADEHGVVQPAQPRAWRRCGRGSVIQRESPGGRGDAAVERQRRLQQHEGPAPRSGRQEALVQQPRLAPAQTPVVDRDARAPQQPRARARRRAGSGRAAPRPRARRRPRRASGAQGGVRPWWQHGSSVT